MTNYLKSFSAFHGHWPRKVIGLHELKIWLPQIPIITPRWPLFSYYNRLLQHIITYQCHWPLATSEMDLEAFWNLWFLSSSSFLAISLRVVHDFLLFLEVFVPLASLVSAGAEPARDWSVDPFGPAFFRLLLLLSNNFAAGVTWLSIKELVISPVVVEDVSITS